MPEVVLTGAAGRIEGRYTAGKTENAPIALILHPHPRAGGQMNHPVAVQLFHLFMKRGFSVLRFNFRGVGRSQGEFDSGIGELADAATALDWLQATNPSAAQCWVAGFDFGAWIGMQLLMRRPETDGFISVSPPTNMYDFSFLAPCPASGMMLHGGADTVTPPQDVE
ncbi:MAG: alpha/beta hydrolase, partial [Phenylobacterium sp.]